MVEPQPTGLGRAQPERTTWVRPPVDPPSAEGTVGARCNVDWVAADGRGLGDPIPGRNFWLLGHGTSRHWGGKSLSLCRRLRDTV